MEQRLHEAAIQGDVTLLQEILREDPLVLDRVNSGWFGRSPLHVAALRGHTNFVKEVLRLNPDLAEILDTSHRLPLHLLGAKGHVEVVQALISVHLDMCLTRDKMSLNYLLTNATLDVNIKNANEYTALDILAQIRKDVKNSNDIEKKLKEAEPCVVRMSGAEWLTKKKETIMLVATLIATIAFQAGMNPPSGFWQDTLDKPPNKHRAGDAIMDYNHPRLYLYFIRTSTMGFVASLSTILLLITGLPFKRRIFMWILVAIMWVTITSMAVTFAISIVVITPRAHSEPISDTIEVAIIVWCSLMGILFLVHTARLLKEEIEEKWSRHLVTKRIKKINSLKSHQPI
ncbi:Ankyrin repeat-containing protein ITN1 [Camellia lanceoleosa]|uniref:Ankyrin repeat-containing protein ITN1 n=1 Tax=Camellia lanceoleosa TaxID=1840588 RepID=A0ACC0G3R5_9ERIC|nr:Ankyrin repeat-containing protein ITN1 [Camellia lanceoleosa]